MNGTRHCTTDHSLSQVCTTFKEVNSAAPPLFWPRAHQDREETAATDGLFQSGYNSYCNPELQFSFSPDIGCGESDCVVHLVADSVLASVCQISIKGGNLQEGIKPNLNPKQSQKI